MFAHSPGVVLRPGKMLRRWEAAVDWWHKEIARLEDIRDGRDQFAASGQSRTLLALDRLLPSPDFEIAWADVLRRERCPIEREHGFPGDKNADVIALTPDSGLRMVFQVKQRSTRSVDQEELWKLNGTARDIHGANIVGLVTNNDFSDEARKFAA